MVLYIISNRIDLPESYSASAAHGQSFESESTLLRVRTEPPLGQAQGKATSNEKKNHDQVPTWVVGVHVPGNT
jgi:hypothetical protein